MPSKATLMTAAVAIVAVALVAMIQRNGFEIPIIGTYLPK
jgi:hypothetical protein